MNVTGTGRTTLPVTSSSFTIELGLSSEYSADKAEESAARSLAKISLPRDLASAGLTAGSSITAGVREVLWDERLYIPELFVHLEVFDAQRAGSWLLESGFINGFSTQLMRDVRWAVEPSDIVAAGARMRAHAVSETQRKAADYCSALGAGRPELTELSEVSATSEFRGSDRLPPVQVSEQVAAYMAKVRVMVVEVTVSARYTLTV